jgi:transposase
MLGIDVSSESLSSALWLDPREDKPLWEQEVPNTMTGIDQLLARTPPSVPLVVEPTGRYSMLVVQRAHQAGRSVLLAPTRKAKAFLFSLSGGRAKTDKLDGRGLALFGHSQPLLPYRLKSEIVDQLDQLLSARRGLTGALSRLKLQESSLPKAREALRPAIEALAKEVKALDKRIATLVRDHPDFAMAAKLQKVPGIGPVTAAALVSRLTSKQFTRPDQFVAYIGLDVGVRRSGKRNGDTGLTKQGDAELRRLLFMCAQATLRNPDNPFATQFKRERAKGLATTAALCAVARKLAHVCWSMHKHNENYHSERVGKPPVKKNDQNAEETSNLATDKNSLDNEP